MAYARRDLLKMGLGALPLGHLLARPGSLLAAVPGATFGGVEIGIIAPYAFRGTASTAKEILKGIVELGIGGVEMQSPPAEVFAGAPPAPPRPPRPQGPPPGSGPAGAATGGNAPPQPRRRELTLEQQAARNARAEAMRKWRLSAPMDKFAELRKMYNDAGVRIYGFKLALTESMPDAEYDYCFEAAKALGASHVTMELNDNTERIGKFAAKHEIYVGYHNHTQVDEHSWDAALAQSPYNGINLDAGHFTAAISGSPIPFIKKHHARITSMHCKDRKYGDDRTNNMPWGQGQTPLREILQLMKQEQYKFPATIELEYPVPEGSTVMAELKKCVAYCKDALA